MSVIVIFIIWLLIAFFAVLNGFFREFVLNKIFNNKVSLVLSGFSLSAIVFLTVYIVMPWLEPKSFSGLLFIGTIWVLTTLLFEYGLGYLQKKNLSEINQVFDISSGNLFSLVLLVTLFSPLVAGYFRGYY